MNIRLQKYIENLPTLDIYAEEKSLTYAGNSQNEAQPMDLAFCVTADVGCVPTDLGCPAQSNCSSHILCKVETHCIVYSRCNSTHDPKNFIAVR